MGVVLGLENITWPPWAHPYFTAAEAVISQALDYVDINYLQWLLWLFTPVIIAFLLPVVLLLFLYGNVVFLHIYRLRHRIREAYAISVWDGARSALSSFWDAQGWIWHGYEVYGLENIPDSGPAMIVYYHGTLPVDVYYLLAKVILYKGRTLQCVADKFLFRIPGWRIIMEVFRVTPGSVSSCVEELGKGHLICISPGGVREALFSHNYELMWANRMGFAKVALRANVPVIPMFTENCREAYRTPVWGSRFWRWLYEKTKLPLVPIYGNFPVKMRTYLGEPITDHIVPNSSWIPNGKTLSLSAEQPESSSSESTEIFKQRTEVGDVKKIEGDVFPSGIGRTKDETPLIHGERKMSEGEERSPELLREKIASQIEELILEHQRQPGSITLSLLDRIPKFRRFEERFFKSRRIVGDL